MNQKAQEEQDRGPLQRVSGQLSARGAASQPRLKGKDDRSAHNKNKAGIDQIRGGDAVPLGVIHEAPGAGAAIVVHHDHEGDSKAAQHVQREQPLGRAPMRAMGWSLRLVSSVRG